MSRYFDTKSDYQIIKSLVLLAEGKNYDVDEYFYSYLHNPDSEDHPAPEIVEVNYVAQSLIWICQANQIHNAIVEIDEVTDLDGFPIEYAFAEFFIDGDPVEFHKGFIRVGCAKIQNWLVEKISRKLIND